LYERRFRALQIDPHSLGLTGKYRNILPQGASFDITLSRWAIGSFTASNGSVFPGIR
jgi:hypothetical protein